MPIAATRSGRSGRGYRVTLTFNLLLTGPDDLRSWSGRGRRRRTSPSTSPRASSVSTAAATLASRRGWRSCWTTSTPRSGLAAGRFKGADAERVATLRRSRGASRVPERARAGRDQGDLGRPVRPKTPGRSDDARPTKKRTTTSPSTTMTTYRAQRIDRRRDHPRLVDSYRRLRTPRRSGSPWTSTKSAWSRRRSPLTPYETEYEGYMGNYGQHPGPVVSPGSGSRVAEGEGLRGARRGGIGLGAADPPRPDRRRRPGWRTGGRGVARAVLDHVEPALLAPALRVAAGWMTPSLARVVVAPFRMEMLTADHAPLAGGTRPGVRRRRGCWSSSTAGSPRTGSGHGSAHVGHRGPAAVVPGPARTRSGPDRGWVR